MDETSDSNASPRHGRLTRRPAGVFAAKVAASAVGVVVVSALVVAGFAIWGLASEVQARSSVSLPNEDVLDGVPDIGAMNGGLNFLLVGSDKRPEDGRFGDPDEDSAVLNDVTMLVHISQDHSHVEVVSFPRDMIVPVPECQDPSQPDDPDAMLSALWGVKLNTVLSYGGFGCVVATIEELTGVTIPVGGVVEFYGVAALSEAVGGVEVCLVDPIDDEYSELHLAAGLHEISGLEALAFLRTRHAVGDGSDLGRISNQQTFLSSLMRTLQSNETLADPVKLYSIAKAVTSNMSLSPRLQNPTVLISIARAVQGIDLSKVVFVQYPTVYTDDSSAVIPAESADAVNDALQRDVPVLIDDTATGGASFGSQGEADADTDAPAPEDSTGDDASETDAATDAPTTAPSTNGPEQLPSDVTGQSAAEVRCTVANAG